MSQRYVTGVSSCGCAPGAPKGGYSGTVPRGPDGVAIFSNVLMQGQYQITHPRARLSRYVAEVRYYRYRHGLEGPRGMVLEYPPAGAPILDYLFNQLSAKIQQVLNTGGKGINLDLLA